MKSKIIYRLKWTTPTILLILFTVLGCASPATAPTLSPAPSSTSSVDMPSMSSTATNDTMIMPTSMPVSQMDPNMVLYHDDFTNQASGWPQDTFDNYFIGYHEPQWYFIQITSPNYKAPVVIEPKKESYQDSSIELQVFTDSANTAPTGDFRYGLVFRRSGDQWYAFTISPRTKKWYVLKSSPNGLTTLQEGVEESIAGLNNKTDILRVDVMGSDFSFYINDKPVGQATDADYAKGEIGLYAESFDSTQTRIHFDALTISKAPPQVPDMGIIYQDDFTNPASGWPEEKFDNYFIGYHEPEYYHIEITSPNYKTTVFDPEKKSFGDLSIETKVFTNSKKTSPTGDFSYGLAFRRSGDQYYAFTISPRTKKWAVLKSSSTALAVLAEGTEAGINDLDVEDTLRVDAQGSNFSFYINDKPVGQVTDPDYAKGEVGFFVQTLDATNVHIHFDSLIIQNIKAPQPIASEAAILYQDVFTNPASGWAEKKFDNYFIGYHEPEYYHIEITSPNYKTTVFDPEKKSFGDSSIETKVFTNSKKTSPTGDFNYGLAFRRSGDQYYAFTISPRTKKWAVLKSSSTALAVLAEGTEAGINDLDVEDTLRVDAQGSNFSFYINDKPVGQVTDADYAKGEVGFFVQTLDATNVHIHFDELTIREFKAALMCNVNALALNVRSGPGTGFASSIFLSKGDAIMPIGRSANGDWIKVSLENNGGQGWVFNKKEFVSCSSDVGLLPVINP